MLQAFLHIFTIPLYAFISTRFYRSLLYTAPIFTVVYTTCSSFPHSLFLKNFVLAAAPDKVFSYFYLHLLFSTRLLVTNIYLF